MNVVELIFFTALMLACLWIAEHVAPYLHGSIYLAFTLVLWVFLISAPASRRIGDLLVGVKKSYPKDDSHK